MPVCRIPTIARRAALLVLAALATAPATASAQQPCERLLCSPAWFAQPGLMMTNVVDAPALRSADGRIGRLGAKADFLIRFGLALPTRIPRTSLFGAMQWAPFADASGNPFTGRSADELGVEAVDANAPRLVYGLVYEAIQPGGTAGWASADLRLLMLFSPAAQPDDVRTYTHKVMPELRLELGILNWLPPGHLLRDLSAYGIVDYVATQLPVAGDPAPGGGTLLNRADPWILIAGLQFPLAPWPGTP